MLLRVLTIPAPIFLSTAPEEGVRCDVGRRRGEPAEKRRNHAPWASPCWTQREMPMPAVTACACALSPAAVVLARYFVKAERRGIGDTRAGAALPICIRRGNFMRLWCGDRWASRHGVSYRDAKGPRSSLASIPIGARARSQMCKGLYDLHPYSAGGLRPIHDGRGKDEAASFRDNYSVWTTTRTSTTDECFLVNQNIPDVGACVIDPQKVRKRDDRRDEKGTISSFRSPGPRPRPDYQSLPWTVTFRCRAAEVDCGGADADGGAEVETLT